MNLNRHRTAFQTSVLALIAVLVVGCSDGAAATREQAAERVDALGDSLAESVILSYQATRGETDPSAGTRAVSEARALIIGLTETAATLDSTSQAAALTLTELANEALVWVGQTEYERAEKLRLEEFIPAAAEFTSTLAGSDAEPASSPVSSWSTGKAIAALAGIALLGIVVAAKYWSGDRPDPVVEAEKRRAERSGLPTQPIQRTWSEIPPLFAEPEAPDRTADEDVPRTTKARSMEIDLKALLMTALHQVKDYGWDMSIVCPELHISADPVKLRHAVVAALGNAFLGGAQRVGLVVEDLDGDVLLTIGRDAPPNQGDAEEFADRFATQITLALGVDGIEWSLINDDDVSLMSVALGRKVAADEVSEPVA